jgi:hypothetical protein
MADRLRWALLAGMLLVIGYVAFAFYISFSFPIEVTFGPTTRTSVTMGCKEYTDYLSFRNGSLTSIPMRDWQVRDSSGIYQFPDRWLEPGAEIRLWSGEGTDDQANLYAGRRQPAWDVAHFGYIVWYAGFVSGYGTDIMCDIADAPMFQGSSV